MIAQTVVKALVGDWFFGCLNNNSKPYRPCSYN